MPRSSTTKTLPRKILRLFRIEGPFMDLPEAHKRLRDELGRKFVTVTDQQLIALALFEIAAAINRLSEHEELRE